MLTLAQLRAQLGADGQYLTDQDIAETAMQVYGPLYRDPKQVQKNLGYDPEWDFGRGLRIAGRNTLAAVGGVGAAAADGLGTTGARDSMLEYARGQQAQARQLGRRSDDVDNFTSDPLSFLSAGAGQAIGYAAPSLLGGGLPYLGARALGAAAAGRTAAAVGGAYTANLGQEVGGIYNELAEQGKYEPGRALLYGAGAAALDTASEAVPFLRGSGAGNMLRRVGVGALKQGGVEAGTEVLQTGIERAGAYKPTDTPEAWHEYRNAAALGALGGGMFGGAMGLRGPKPPLPDNAPSDLLQLGLDPRVGPARDGVYNNQPFVTFPDGSTATSTDAALLQREGLTPERLDNLRSTGAVPSDPTMAPQGPPGVAPYLPNVMYGDQLGAVATDATGADALYGLEQGDPGLAEARRRILEQQQAKAKFEQDKAAVAQATAERQALTQRTQEMTGVTGSTAVDLVGQLEAMRAQGTMDDTAFTSALALVSTREFGKVKKLVKDATPKVAPDAQPNVPGAAPVAAGAPGLGGAGPARSSAAVGLLADVPGGAPGTTATQPVARSAAPVAVGSGNQPGTALTVAPPLAQGAKMSPAEVTAAAQARLAELGIDPNKPMQVTTAGGKPETVMAREVMERMYRADAVDQVLYDAALGGATNKPLTLDQMAVLVERRTGKKVSKQAVQKRLGKYGLTAATVDEAAGMAPDAVSVAELGVDEAGSLDGFRVADTLSDVAAEGKVLPGAPQTRAQRIATEQADTLLATAPTSKLAVDTAAVDDFENELAPAERAQLEERNAQAIERNRTQAPSGAMLPTTVEQALERDLARNDVAPVDIEDARETWDAERLDVDHTFDELDVDLQAVTVRMYRNDKFTAQRQGEIVDEQTRRNTKRAAAPRLDAPRADAGRDSRAGGAQPALGASQEGNPGAAAQVRGPAGPDVAPAKAAPKSFRKSHGVETQAFDAETDKFVPHKTDAATALDALRADIGALEAFLSCIKGR